MRYTHASMGIQDAIRSVPAKPGLIIALSATMLFGGWYVYVNWHACENRAKAATDIRLAVEAAMQGEGIVDLGELFPFPWDELRVVSDYRPSRHALSCPFRWLGGSHWSLEERHALAQDNRLAAISLSQQGEAVAFIEYLKEWGDFEIGDDALPREQARFRLVFATSESEPPRLRVASLSE